jgi:hypothetical protein
MTIKRTGTKRPYNNITDQTVVKFKALEFDVGNGTEAVRVMNPEILNPALRAFRIRTKANEESALDFIDNTLQQIGIDSINRVGLMVNSNDEKIATKNSHFVIDHIRGKAMQKSISLSVKRNIQSVLD